MEIVLYLILLFGTKGFIKKLHPEVANPNIKLGWIIAIPLLFVFMGIGLAVAGLIMAANFCAAVFHKCPFCGKFFMEERKESFEKKPVFCPRCGMLMPKSFRNDIF